jgi:hypothetical protein
MQPYKQLDKQANKKHDYNCCTVIATATVCEMSYNRTYKKLERVGRKHRRGTWMFYEVIRRQGYDMQKVENTRGMTVSKFAELYPKGTYLLHVRAHAIAIVDGVINDHTNEEILKHKSKRRIKHCHQIIKQDNSHIKPFKDYRAVLRFLTYN